MRERIPTLRGSRGSMFCIPAVVWQDRDIWRRQKWNLSRSYIALTVRPVRSFLSLNRKRCLVYFLEDRVRRKEPNREGNPQKTIKMKLNCFLIFQHTESIPLQNYTNISSYFNTPTTKSPFIPLTYPDNTCFLSHT